MVRIAHSRFCHLQDRRKESWRWWDGQTCFSPTFRDFQRVRLAEPCHQVLAELLSRSRAAMSNAAVLIQFSASSVNLAPFLPMAFSRLTFEMSCTGLCVAFNNGRCTVSAQLTGSISHSAFLIS